MRAAKFALSLFAAVALVATAAAASVAAPGADASQGVSAVPDVGPVLAADGKSIFTSNKCTECHAIKSQGVARTGELEPDEKEPPDLSKTGTKGHTAAVLTQFLLKKDKIDGKKHKKKFKGDEATLKTLVDWLLTLK